METEELKKRISHLEALNTVLMKELVWVRVSGVIDSVAKQDVLAKPKNEDFFNENKKFYPLSVVGKNILSERTRRTLVRNKIMCINNILFVGLEKIKKIEHLGKIGINEIVELCEKNGFELK